MVALRVRTIGPSLRAFRVSYMIFSGGGVGGGVRKGATRLIDHTQFC